MALGKAINYTINQFEKFRRYLDDGKLKIDNNRAERAIMAIRELYTCTI